MELQIDKKIKEYRRQADLTQEKLAEILGVSPQSISKWETGDGYPDITLLPVIANHFGITIDELVGNDAIGREEERKKFSEQFNNLHGNPAEQIRLAAEMWRKYPDEWYVAKDLVSAIMDAGDNIKEYMSQLREVCRTIVDKCTISYVRERAVLAMCTVCGDDELEEWNEYLPSGFSTVLTRDDMLEERYWHNGEREKAQTMWGINNLHRICAILKRNARHGGDPGKNLDVQRNRLAMMDFLTGGEEVTSWMAYRALTTFRVAASLFGLGRKEEGYIALEKGIALYEQWFALPAETELNIGDEALFGKITAKRGVSFHVFLPDGSRHHVGEWVFSGYPEPCAMLTAAKGWEWFNSVREEERFKAVVKRAEVLAEAK